PTLLSRSKFFAFEMELSGKSKNIVSTASSRIFVAPKDLNLASTCPRSISIILTSTSFMRLHFVNDSPLERCFHGYLHSQSSAGTLLLPRESVRRCIECQLVS